MTFSLAESWVWDSWTAIDGDTVHLFYLRAPKDLGDPQLRHRNAAIGHATSTDLVTWTDHGVVLEHGPAGSFDASATWTGSVFRDEDAGLWRMYYTGSRFLAPDRHTNIETVLMATSTDLHTWRKEHSTVLSATAPWYETLPDGTWREEAWRDPWVFPDRSGAGWHMLITARARDVPEGVDADDRAVVGYATSTDLIEWTAREPLSAPGAGFAHLEVLQLVAVDGRDVLVFSCDSEHLAGHRTGGEGGVWYVPLPHGIPFDGSLIDLTAARRVTGDELYAARIVAGPAGAVLLGFENIATDGSFVGRVSDPIPVSWDDEGRLVAQGTRVAA